MKQVKFFLVALMAVVMGMSVTSCLSSTYKCNFLGADNKQ